MKRLFLLIFLLTLTSFSFAAPPSFITITSPQDGSYLNNTVLIEAQLTQIPQARSVKFYIDNQQVGEDTTSPYQYTWDTTKYPDGIHKIYASIPQLPRRPFQRPSPLVSPKISVTVDNTPPSGTIKINNDFQYTNSAQVTLNISATDSVSGLDKMQFSNDGAQWSTPEDYATSRSYTLPSGDGTKTVSAKFKDVAGNWSNPISDEIILDTTAPLIAITSPGSISGKVTLQSRTNHQGLITFRLTIPGESTPFRTYEVNTASDGGYTLNDVPSGIYNLSAKHQIFLRQNQVLIEVTEGQTTPNVNFNLLGGDCDNNNVVSLVDFAILRAAKGTKPGDPKWDERADFNGNSQIDLTDFAILRSNSGKSGREPQITITSPEDNSITTSASISVSGTIDDNFSTVKVNSTPANVANYTFKASNIALSQGLNRIFAVATNTIGNKNADFITIIYDDTAPSKPIVSDDGVYTNTLTALHATWTESEDLESGIVEYQYSIGTAKGSTDSVDWTSVGTDTEVTRSDLTLTLGQTYFINVMAKNGAGLFSQISSSDGIIANDGITLLLDIVTPFDGALVNASTITVSGTVSDSTATVTVNGTSATVVNNTFTASVTLTEGPNTITAKAVKDTLSAEDTINVILDQDPPSINIYTPDANSTTRSNIVYGRVSDDTQSVTVNGTPAEPLDDFRFIARPTLTEGQNTITVEAQDKASNTTQASINITYNTQTPKVTITLPLDNSEINISPIKVEGTTTSDIQFILVNSSTALIDNLNFTAEGITLDTTKSVITASGYDENHNIFQDSIVINSPNLAHYELTKISGDATEDDLNRPQAGSEQILRVKLEKNYSPSPDEEIQFKITQGNGALSNPYSFTDINGEAQVTITLDINSDITNQVECYPSSNPLVKITFLIDTRPAAPYTLTKITDDSITPVPGATMDLIVKLADSNNNPIQDETINFQVISGDGTLSSPSATTTYYGEAKTNLTCPNIGLVLTQIKASSQIVPSITTTFNITTSAPLTVTVDDIINKVNYNDSKIQDIKADITVTSNAPFLPQQMQLKIWQKGDKQKVEEISPEPKVYIRPVLSQVDPSTFMTRTIISSDSINNIYAIKSKASNQTDEFPYEIDYIDYNRGVVMKTEYNLKENNFECLQIKEYSDFIQIGDIWGFQKETENIYAEGKFLYTATSIYYNIQINTGIPDSEFQ